MKIAIVGTGYVGLVTGTCLAEVGHTVVCVDVNVEKITMLRDGRSPIFEPGLDTLIQRNIEQQRLSFTTVLKEAMSEDCDVVFIAVGTPEGEDGSADLRYVVAVAKEIGKHATHSLLAIVKSTVPVGTCDMVEETIASELKARKVNFTVAVASNPEFLKEGAAIDDFMKPDRIVVGLKKGVGQSTLEDLYRPFITDDPGRLFVVDRRSSELTKYGANAMLATRISFMNELSRLCDRVGANIDHVRRGMGSDPRIGKKFLYAGPGYGGSCFPKDVEALIKTGAQYGQELKVLSAVSAANIDQKHYVSTLITEYFGDLRNKTIAIWGLAFKPGTDDVREAPAATIIETLLKAGATIKAHDPEACETFKRDFPQLSQVDFCDDAYKTVTGADALVLVTEWPEYKRPNWDRLASLMRSKSVFDFRNQFNADEVMKSGFYYCCVGRPDSRTSQ
jgi:UDPglucose 6-dehydrogenase